MEYGAYLIAIFLIKESENFANLENDEQFTKAIELYKEFVNSDFNDEENSEYESISNYVDYITTMDKIKTLMFKHNDAFNDLIIHNEIDYANEWSNEIFELYNEGLFAKIEDYLEFMEYFNSTDRVNFDTWYKIKDNEGNFILVELVQNTNCLNLVFKSKNKTLFVRSVFQVYDTHSNMMYRINSERIKFLNKKK